MDQRPPAIFVGDALGLDFLNSIATPVDTPIDWIDDGDGLLSWLEQAQLVPADALKTHSGAGAPRRARQGRGSGEELREWFRGFVRKHKGRPLTAKDLAQLEPLNRLLERDERSAGSIPRLRRAKPLQLQTSVDGARPTPCCSRSERRWHSLYARRIFQT